MKIERFTVEIIEELCYPSGEEKKVVHNAPVFIQRTLKIGEKEVLFERVDEMGTGRIYEMLMEIQRILTGSKYKHPHKIAIRNAARRKEQLAQRVPVCEETCSNSEMSPRSKRGRRRPSRF